MLVIFELISREVGYIMSRQSMPSRKERTVPRNKRQERSAAGWGESLDLACLFLPRAQMTAFGLLSEWPRVAYCLGVKVI